MTLQELFDACRASLAEGVPGDTPVVRYGCEGEGRTFTEVWSSWHCPGSDEYAGRTVFLVE